MIGWYVHHHGAGHLHRMLAVTAHLDEEVTVLSSLPRPDDWDGGWVRLERDDALGPQGRDVTARGALHWVPRHDAGLAARSAQLAAWVAEARPRLVVVDVSVEVTLLARLCGAPVVVVAMPGDRGDRPHRLGYDVAELRVGAWPPEATELVPGPVEGSRAAPLHAVGAISRFDGRPPAGPRRPGTAYLLWGSGGAHDREELLARLRRADPRREWIGQASTADPDEVWRHLCTAEVVVTHAGQNAVAEVAAAAAPAVVVADPRPFDEQEHTVARLERLGIGVPLVGWPDDARLPGLLDRAAAAGGAAWGRWHDGKGARRFADLLAGWTPA
ncbi:glycosyltransferase [Nocardioides solisilvae]|uniref:glycosyltransferase n=1 Tax=Nocardioides solisilvae TaxID=1542435 RepID=UPI000D7459B4|nr:glycosyltransferase [Nocardioides solisilvae]